MFHKKESHGGIRLGVGILLGIAAGLGAYFFCGRKGTARRAQLRNWIEEMKGEVLQKTEELGEFTRGAYEKIVEEAAAGYRGMKGIDPGELKGAVEDLKARWRTIRREFLEAREGED